MFVFEGSGARMTEGLVLRGDFVDVCAALPSGWTVSIH